MSYVAVWWDQEGLYTVGKTKSILGDESEQRVVGDGTMARHGRKRYHAIVMKFSDNEQELKQAAPALFKQFSSAGKIISPGESVIDDDDDEDGAAETDLTIVSPVPVSRKQPSLADEPQRVRREISFTKREREVARREANQQATMESVALLNTRRLEEKVESLERVIDALSKSNETLVSSVTSMRSDMDTLLQRATCRSCLKAHLKSSASTKTTTPDHLHHQAPMITSAVDIVATSLPPVMLPEPVQDTANVLPSATSPRPRDTPPEVSGPPMAMSDNMSQDELSYLGDAQYGVKLRTEDIRRCELSSTTGIKLALHLLQFLVTPEECRTCSVYGQAKEKTPMDPKKRKALRSHIFSLYYLDCSKEEKEKIWIDQVVYKLNDKIRGIKNGRYRSFVVM